MDNISTVTSKKGALPRVVSLDEVFQHVCLVFIGYTTAGKYIQNQAKRCLLPHRFALKLSP